MIKPEHNKILTYELAHRSLTQVLAETTTLVLVTLAAIVGNSCVLYVFYKSPRLHTVTNYYIITLAVSDVAMAMIVMPGSIAVAAYGREVVGVTAGQVIGFIAYSLISGSLQTTTLIGINRFFCVVKPLLYRRYFKSKPAMLMITGVWILSFSNTAVICFSGMAAFEFLPGRFIYMLAYSNRTTELISNSVSCFLFVVIPLSMTSVCYWKICEAVRAHNNAVSSSLHVGPSGSGSSLSKEEVHVTKSALALVCGFVICWVPCTTILFLASYINLTRHVEMIFTYTVYSSSAINPIVFNLFNKPFRNQFAQVFGFKTRIRRVGPSNGQGGISLSDRT